MDLSLHVDPEHFEYLKLQKGNLDKHVGTFNLWRDLYQADIANTYKAIAPYLPHACTQFLDVGSGLGGIDVLIRRHYEETQSFAPGVHLLDGLNDPPVMTLHRRTFNSMYMARNFQVKNGLSPLDLETHGPDTKCFPEPFDLIVSFGSWCFHFPPSVYLPALLVGGIQEHTVAIIDVRNGKPWFLDELKEVFEVVRCITERPKWSRIVFRVKPGIV